MCTRQRHCGDNQYKSSKVEKDEKKRKKRNQAKLESKKELKVATFFTVFFFNASFFPVRIPLRKA